MEVITLILLGALAVAFIGSVISDKFEFPIMAILLTFCSFVGISKDASIAEDTVMLLYVPLITVGLFSIASFFRSKVH